VNLHCISEGGGAASALSELSPGSAEVSAGIPFLVFRYRLILSPGKNRIAIVVDYPGGGLRRAMHVWREFSVAG